LLYTEFAGDFGNFCTTAVHKNDLILNEDRFQVGDYVG
jgi:hypothetical protein